ncbi:hypothetical protein [Allorhizocola rhizosphaerae]|uniref:hypothetical protein n=1 Tax=Allorhizocola rhizosphaerae TaxID=1872709 RepID=UPI000E3C384B|nr:hypothetical protein [Allorhizocola rhizosphaerae]
MRLLLVHAADLPQLKPYEELEDEYFWAGENLLFVIDYLWREKGISLFSIAHHDLERRLNDANPSSATIIVGPEHKPLLDKLHPSNHDPADLRRALIYRGVSPREAGPAAVDGLKLLYDQLLALPDDSVFVIHVG